jgi:hypothetical protein
MKGAALDDRVPTEKLHAIIRANGYLMEAYRGGLRIKANPSLFRRVRKAISERVPSALRRLFSRQVVTRGNDSAIETSAPRLYSQKDLVKRLHLRILVGERR